MAGIGGGRHWAVLDPVLAAVVEGICHRRGNAVGTDEQSTGRNKDSSVHRSTPRASGSDARNGSEQHATRGEHRPVGFEHTGRANRAGHARAWSLPMEQSPCHGSGSPKRLNGRGFNILPQRGWVGVDPAGIGQKPGKGTGDRAISGMPAPTRPWVRSDPPGARRGTRCSRRQLAGRFRPAAGCRRVRPVARAARAISGFSIDSRRVEKDPPPAVPNWKTNSIQYDS